MEELWRKNKRGRTQQGKDTRFYLVKKKINKSMALDFLFTGHREHCQQMSQSLQQAHHHLPEGSPFQHHSSTSIRPKIILWWQWSRRILWPATDCHWSDTEEGHSCCVRRLECKRGQGCLWKLASHLWTLLHWWHKWERTQTSGVCHL